MRTIYKYTFVASNSQATFSMPRAAIPRRVAIQDRNVCLWAEVNTDEPVKQRTFQIIGTGHKAPDNWYYIGTCDDTPFVWHVGELI